MALGVLDDIVWKSQLLGDGKGIALARDADQQAVGGPQGLHAELTAGVLHTGGAEGKHLELAVVGGGHGAALHVVKEGQDGDGQGCSLRGIRACAQLIKETEGAGVRLIQDPHRVGHVGGEGGKILLDALLIADICEYLVKHSQL